MAKPTIICMKLNNLRRKGAKQLRTSVKVMVLVQTHADGSGRRDRAAVGSEVVGGVEDWVGRPVWVLVVCVVV